MYRILILGLVLFSINTGYSQPKPKILGTWIAQECKLEINDTTQRKTNIIDLAYNTHDSCTISIFRDSIYLKKISVYSSGETDTEIFNFKIIGLSDSFLYLVPGKENLRYTFYKDSLIKFTRKEVLLKKTINLEKIIFHSSICFGTCPVLHIEIDSNRQIFYNGQVSKGFNPEIDPSLSGTFKGTLNFSSYNNLIDLLHTSNLEELEFNNETCCDGPIVTIIVYFNGQRKYLKYMFPPLIAHDLIQYFYNV